MSLTGDAENVVVKIQDTGKGISPEFLPQRTGRGILGGRKAKHEGRTPGSGSDLRW